MLRRAFELPNTVLTGSTLLSSLSVRITAMNNIAVNAQLCDNARRRANPLASSDVI